MAITIAAAASLINGLPTAITNFKDSDPEYENVEFNVTYGSSGALARQIVAGTLPADIFISASVEAMDVADNAGKIVSGSRQNWIANTLELIEKTTTSGSYVGIITSYGDVNPTMGLSTTHIWLPNPYFPDYVPAGIYSEAAFRTYTPNSDHWGYAFGKAVYENTVRQDVQYTLNGIVADPYPAIGSVYHSDALGAGAAVTHLAYAPLSVNNDIIYPAARVIQTPQDAVAAAFLAFLYTEDARNIFTDPNTGTGFRPLNSAPPTDTAGN
jgi:molybdate transport system substrate-binding protein